MIYDDVAQAMRAALCLCTTRRSYLRFTAIFLTLIAVCSAAFAQNTQLKHLNAVPFTKVKISDKFWAPRCETNRKVSIPHNLAELEKAGNLNNFKLAVENKHDSYKGPVFMDSDVYKVLEAASFSLATHPNPALDKQVDDLIAIIAKAQMADGYIDTYYEVNMPDQRWTNLRDNHEMYCAGHMIEAAVAHFQATGKHNFLDVATKCADNIDRIFGSDPGKRMGYPGHPELELALIKLWRATGNERYFKLAQFFVENRGSGFFAKEPNNADERTNDLTYWLDNKPLKDQTSIIGHAVRAAYLLSGATDVAGVTNDNDLLNAIHKIWRNTVEKRMFVTGGIGPSSSNEGFTIDYDLPTFSAYQESCASIAMAMWNQRLALLYGDAKYADYVEKALYNGVLAGISLKGDKFFYSNPLASSGERHRTPWFECACCPPNLIRTLASVGGYAYATSDDGVCVNLYIQGTAECSIGKNEIKMNVTTDYPWDGAVKISPIVKAPASFKIMLRVPGWCKGASVKLNGKAVSKPQIKSGYIVLNKNWTSNDVIDLDLPMPVRKIQGNPQISSTSGMIALQRGPIVYCLEGCDQKVPVSSISIPMDSDLKAARQPNLLGGVVTISGIGKATEMNNWAGALYKEAPLPAQVKFTAVPYYAWDNRTSGEMQVWVPANPKPEGGMETFAIPSTSFVRWGQPSIINDGREIRSSSDWGGGVFGWWPHLGTTEWVQYKWKKPVAVGGSKVYWYAEAPQPATTSTSSNRNRRRSVTFLPAAWHIEYLDGGTWKPVEALGKYPVEADSWCQVTFKPVKTTSLRLVTELQPEKCAAIHEWKVLPPDGDE